REGHPYLADAGSGVADQEPLPLELQALGLQLEIETGLLEASRLQCVRVLEPRRIEPVAGRKIIALGDHALVPGPLRALELALGRGDVDAGEIARLPAFEHL